MSLLLETIRICDGVVERFEYHQRRAKEAARELFNVELKFDLEMIHLPNEFEKGIVKCRVIYDTMIREITFEKYQIKRLASLKVIEENTIDYSCKYLDRGSLNSLLQKKGDADEVLILKNGEITDISYANVAVRIGEELFTPLHPLLKGTRRQSLIDCGILKERILTIEDLNVASELLIINAMVGLEDNITILIEEIVCK